MSDAEQHEEAVFEAALKLQGEARAAYLDEACAGDPALRERVEGLLGALDRAGQLLSEPAVSRNQAANAPAPQPAAQPGDHIRGYKLLQQIGEGGCGVVYMAEQTEPVKRRVALKILKLGLDTKQVIARFEAERQALALMDHPNIAKVLDAGATETGRPYFVMELVRGVKITDFSDENQLPMTQRLELFIQVCQAIQHAHQKGIIHRDIKPSNILVTVNDGVPVPKVIDFGIAKATTGQPLTDKTVFTAFEQFIGTPAYMSPEQAVMTSVDIDTRSDIYSLGVLLYELLTGKTPFETKELLQAGLDEMRRTIREKEPARPSTRLSTMVEDELTTTAKRRRTEAPKLIHAVRGDLDWMVMKCLEKERVRRYETANGLAVDLQRHLNSEPVIACPPSAAYRFRKLVKRNKRTFTTAIVVAVALLVGIGISLWQAVEKSRAYDRVVASEQKSVQVAHFLKHMLRGVGPSVAQGRDTRLLREILDHMVERLDKELTNQPAVEIELRGVLGTVYEELGLYQQSEAMARDSLRIARTAFGEENEFVALARLQLGESLRQSGRLAEAETNLQESLAIQTRVSGQDSLELASPLEHLARVLAEQGHPDEAEAMARRALGLRRKFQGNDNEDVANSIKYLAFVLRAGTKWKESVTLMREALTLQQKLLGDLHPEVVNSIASLGAFLIEENKADEAERLMREALETQKKIYPGDHPAVSVAYNNLGALLLEAKRYPEAEEAVRTALAMDRRLFTNDNCATANSLNSLAIVLGVQRTPDKVAEAETTQRAALDMQRRLVGDENPQTANFLATLAGVLQAQEKYDAAEPLARESLATRRKLFGEAHPEIAKSLDMLVEITAFLGKLDESESLARESVQMHRKLRGPLHPLVVTALNNLAIRLQQYGKLVEAEATHREALDLYRKLYGPDHTDIANCLAGIANVLADEGKPEEAVTLFREAVEMQQKVAPGDTPRQAIFLGNLGTLLYQLNRLTEAEPFVRDALAMQRRLTGDGHPSEGPILEALAAILSNQGKLAEAETMMRQVLALKRKYQGEEHPAIAPTLRNLAFLMWKQDKLVEAEGLFREALTIVRNSLSDQEPDLNRTLNSLGTVLRLQGKLKDAEVFLREAVKNSNAALGKTPPFLPVLLRNQAAAYAGLAATLLDGANFNDAESIAREGLATAEKELPNDWLTFSIRSVLGASLLGQKKSAEAGPLLVSAYEGLDQRWEKIEQANKFPVSEAIKRLITFYESTDRPDQAAEWKQKLADYYKAVSPPKPADATQ